MKALCIKEPWASKILSGEKTIETRKWNTKFRGEFLIVVSRLPKNENSGMAIGIANLDRVEYPMRQRHEKDACCPVYNRAHCFFLNSVRRILSFPVKGRLGFFDVEFPNSNLTGTWNNT